MEKKIKVFNGVFKAFDEKSHTATVIVSTGSVDRDQEIVKPESFKKRIETYKAHPVFLACHNPWELENQIGEAKSVNITDNGIEVEFEWYAGQVGADGKSLNPKADWAWFLATRKIAAFSIGFRAYAWEDGKRNADGSFVDGVIRSYTDIELMEISQVIIPSNRDALQARREALGGTAKGVEVDLLEMACKSIKDEEWCEEKPEPVLLSVDQIAQVKEIVASSIQEAVAEYEKTVGELKARVEELSRPKHAPAGEGSKTLSSPTLADVKSWIKEGMTKSKEKSHV